MAVSQSDALFSLLGTIYGGDGRTTFGLPDMRGRIPIHAGSGAGLSQRRLGARVGTEKETLTVNHLPAHSHTWGATDGVPVNVSPKDAALAKPTPNIFHTARNNAANMNTNKLTNVGGSRSHSNFMPYLCINFIIALFGIYPSRH